MKKKIVLGVVVFVSCLALGLPWTVTDAGKDLMVKSAAAETAGSEFAWHPNRPGIKRAQIALGRAATLRFEFSLKGKDGTQVKFGLPRKYADMGVRIEPNEVSVSGGQAASKAVMSVPPGMPLGKFDVPVIAVDAKTGAQLGRGEIPIMLLPAGVGGC
jgi:hypothetical protein